MRLKGRESGGVALLFGLFVLPAVHYVPEQEEVVPYLQTRAVSFYPGQETFLCIAGHAERLYRGLYSFRLRFSEKCV